MSCINFIFENKTPKTWVILWAFTSVFCLTACEQQSTSSHQPNLLLNQEKSHQPTEKMTNVSDEKNEKFQILNATVRPISIVKPTCKNQCPEVDISTISSNYPQIDDAVKRHIVNYVGEILQGFDIEQPNSSIPEGKMIQSPVSQVYAQRQQIKLDVADTDVQVLQQHIDDFYHLVEETAQFGSSNKMNLYIKPQILNPQGPVATVAINASNYLGGAHGSSGQQYLNFDLAQGQILHLDHLLKAGKRKQFNQLAFKHYQQWVEQNQPDANFDDYQKMWTFSVPENFYLSTQGLLLQYGEYEIGPYAVGLPQLIIPYDQLQDIVKSEYLPTSNQHQDKNIVKQAKPQHQPTSKVASAEQS